MNSKNHIISLCLNVLKIVQVTMFVVLLFQPHNVAVYLALSELHSPEEFIPSLCREPRPYRSLYPRIQLHNEVSSHPCFGRHMVLACLEETEMGSLLLSVLQNSSCVLTTSDYFNWNGAMVQIHTAIITHRSCTQPPCL